MEHNHSMRAALLIVTLFSLLYTTKTMADIRLLVVFDESGHRIHQVHRFNSDPSAVIRALRRARTGASDNSKSHHKASVIWLGARGQQLLVDTLQDPRLARAPVVVDESSGSQLHTLVTQEGVYLLRGPDAAVSARISLPLVKSGDESWPAERWTLDISAN